MRRKGIQTVILWTPGTDGNVDTDILAKTAAREAKEIPPENNLITLQDVKQGACKSTIKKWQRRWDISDIGRDLYDKVPSVDQITTFDYPSKRHYSIYIHTAKNMIY